MNSASVSLLAAIVATAAIAAGCGDDGGDTTTRSSSNGSASSGELPDLKGQQLVFVNYGGDTLDAAKAAWLDPFSEETGVQFATDSPSDPAKVKAMVQAGRTTWDVIDVDSGTGGAGCGTLFEKRKDVDIGEVDPKLVSDDCMVPIMLQSLGLTYNKDKFGDDPPTKITDFFDTERFPGKRIMFNYAVGGFEPLLLADGLEPDQVYPIDYDRAQAAYDKIKDDLTLQSDVAQQAQAQQSGDFAMCMCYFGRSAIAAEKGGNIGIVWDHVFLGTDGLYAIKGSKHPEAQMAFLNYVATPDAQAQFTEQLPYGPTTPSSKPKVSELFEQYLPELHKDEMNGPLIYDAEWWKTNADAAFAKWTAMTSG